MDACDFLSIERPVLQGAMGAVARHDLIVAVSNAGGLGTLSYLPPPMFETELYRIRESLGETTFAANLLLPIISKAHVQACLKSDVPIVTLFYGFDLSIVSALKEAGKIIMFQVGSLAEAQRVFSAGVDGVIVQGVEAGGHLRGRDRLADLLPSVKDAFPDKLVCGAGGVYDSESVQACRALGADAVCSGTRFLMSPEASAHPAYKQRLIDGAETVVTNLFGVGWRDPHRVMPNAAVEKWCAEDGMAPGWLGFIHTVTRIASKFASSDGGAAMTARQSLSNPLYTPTSLTPEMAEELIEVVALYAGECVGQIHELQPADTTVAALS